MAALEERQFDSRILQEITRFIVEIQRSRAAHGSQQFRAVNFPLRPLRPRAQRRGVSFIELFIMLGVIGVLFIGCGTALEKKAHPRSRARIGTSCP